MAGFDGTFATDEASGSKVGAAEILNFSLLPSGELQVASELGLGTDVLTYEEPATFAAQLREKLARAEAAPGRSEGASDVRDAPGGDVERIAYLEPDAVAGLPGRFDLIDGVGTSNKLQPSLATVQDACRVTGTIATAGALELLGL